jgi:hypothetical protein
MSATAIRKKETTANNQKVDVLYQRIGNRWYAFSAQNNDVFFGAIPDEVLSELENRDENIVSGEAVHAAINGANAANGKI